MPNVSTLNVNGIDYSLSDKTYTETDYITWTNNKFTAVNKTDLYIGLNTATLYYKINNTATTSTYDFYTSYSNSNVEIYISDYITASNHNFNIIDLKYNMYQYKYIKITLNSGDFITYYTSGTAAPVRYVTYN